MSLYIFLLIFNENLIFTLCSNFGKSFQLINKLVSFAYIIGKVVCYAMLKLLMYSIYIAMTHDLIFLA